MFEARYLEREKATTCVVKTSANRDATIPTATFRRDKQSRRFMLLTLASLDIYFVGHFLKTLTEMHFSTIKTEAFWANKPLSS
jgi:hypothetical protein